jgi:hypothetical protein
MMEREMDMVERVAWAICAKEYEDPNELTNAYPDGPMYPVWKDFEWCARAAIKALREPTQQMRLAGIAEWSRPDPTPEHGSTLVFNAVWRAMLDAALKEHEG